MDSSPHAMDVLAVAQSQQTDSVTGLSSTEADRRIQEVGSNSIATTRGRSVWNILFAQFKGPIVIVLFVAAIISLFIGERLDAIAIAAVIAINGAIGFYLEYQAARSMKALGELGSIKITVLRSGSPYQTDVDGIVPGDVVLLEAGDLVPADGRIVEMSSMQVDESALTGESIPVEKQTDAVAEDAPLAERKCMVYRGTHVTRGVGRMVVTSTGMQTELGRIAGLVSTSEQNATPLEKKLELLSRRMIVITIAIACVVLVAGLLAGRPAGELFAIMLALSVAAIPEGLPIVATVALARGMLIMAKQNVVVKHLSAVETIGAADVIATDKTGTLTENAVIVEVIETQQQRYVVSDSKQLATTQDEDLRHLLLASLLCNNVRTAESGDLTGDALEIALLNLVRDVGLDVNSIAQQYPRIEELPFSSETKFMATLHEDRDASGGGATNGFIVFAKGAAEVLLSLQGNAEEWTQKEQALASEGLRVIGFSYARHASKPQDLSDGLTFIGLVGMVDPIRSDVAAAISACMAAGIRVVMITGDHPTTARKIGSELGIAEADVYARITPEKKLDIVAELQSTGHVVVMTGDGINDAPPLKKADVGIAMGIRGVAVAQEVADVIIKDDSFTSIVNAVREGRIIFRNIRSFIIYLLSGNLSELLAIGAAAVLNVNFQLLPLQILFINLLSDVLPALALGFTRGGKNIMKGKPHGLNEPLITADHWRSIIVFGSIIGLCSMGAVFFTGLVSETAMETTGQNNVFFFTLVLAQMMHVFNMGGGTAISQSVLRNHYVWIALGVNVLLIVLVHIIPIANEVLGIQTIALQHWLIILAFSTLSFILNFIARRVLLRI